MKKSELKQLIREVIEELSGDPFKGLHSWILTTFRGKQIHGDSVLTDYSPSLTYTPEKTPKHQRLKYNVKKLIALDVFFPFGFELILGDDGKTIYDATTKEKLSMQDIKKKILDGVNELENMSEEEYIEANLEL